MTKSKTAIVLGAGGFIGGHLLRKLLKTTTSNLFNLDYLNYSSDIESIKKLDKYKDRHSFYKLDLRNFSLVCDVVNTVKPDLIIPPNIAEQRLKNETALQMVKRLSQKKCKAILEGNKDAIIIAVGHDIYKKFTKDDFKRMLKSEGVLIDVKSLYPIDYLSELNITHWRL